jgi:hypothetical protein|tara:strand:+ start:4292 stop:5344 length:1053 start_codon:yes stop_codon:yes gene_type:complete
MRIYLAGEGDNSKKGVLTLYKNISGVNRLFSMYYLCGKDYPTLNYFVKKRHKQHHSLFLDSGAPTLYNKFARKVGGEFMGAHMSNRKHDDFSFLESEFFLDYREKHIEFLKEHKHHFDVYTILDIINNQEATWEQQQYYESKGLNPLPVWHFGSDEKWLRLYLEKGYKYIGIGGMVPNPRSILIPSLNNIWQKYLTNTKGEPIVKIHGFAMTSTLMMQEYPWHSVDSTTWIKIGMYGGILLPDFVKGKPDFLEGNISLSVSSKSKQDKKKLGHISNYPEKRKAVFIEYLREKGYVIGKSIFKHGEEKIVEKGLCNQRNQRLRYNMQYFQELQKHISEQPRIFKVKKNFNL